MRLWLSVSVSILAASCLACSGSPTKDPLAGSSAPNAAAKIKHVVVIMQENRSFDSYFGTYPGADGIPMAGGKPTVCLPDPQTKTCVAPYHDPNDVNGGGPHHESTYHDSFDNGKMDGFIVALNKAAKYCTNQQDPSCRFSETPDVMGWHDAREIPNYWAYANNFVLQDHMFAPNISWSLPSHLFMVSEWSAKCTTVGQPSSCTNDVEAPGPQPLSRKGQLVPPVTEADGDTVTAKTGPDYAWTDLTYLLHKNNIPWGYYVTTGLEPDCRNDAALVCSAPVQDAHTPGIWNPLPYFDTVRQDGELGNIRSTSDFFQQAKSGSLPAVSWVIPSDATSEHPPSTVSAGQSYVTSLINAAMSGPDWASTAIFLAWDDWGGFYDHVVPPKVDQNGFGFRVPGLLISPYAKKGVIDHQTLSFDSYVKFIEDVFLGGARIDPATDGRSDPRPDVRETLPQVGDLISEFDFSQTPRPPLLLPVHPPPGPASQ